MKHLLTLLFLLILTTTNAQLWEKTYTADSIGNGFGFANDVIQTKDNGYLMGGEVDLPTGAIRHHIQLKKTDENGNLIWSRIYDYGQIQNDRLAQVHELPNGDLLIGGATAYPTNGILILRTNSVGDTIWRKVVPTPNAYFNSNFDKISNGQFLSFARNNTDVKLIKSDTNGLELLNKSLEEYFIPKAAAELSTGDYILTGEKNGQLYLMKTNQFGDSIWTKKYQFGTGDFGSAIQSLANGEFLIGGATSGFAGFNPFIIKFDANGSIIWNTSLQVLSPTGHVSDIILDSIGKIYATGAFDADNFFSFQGGFIARLDANGTNQVLDTLNTVNRTDGSALILSNDGCLVVTGGNENGYYLRKQCDLTSTFVINHKEINLLVYPNPMQDILHFSIDNEEKNDFNLKIYDANGRIIHQKNVENEYKFQNSNLPKGVYFYTLSIDNQIVNSGKFIKN